MKPSLASISAHYNAARADAIALLEQRARAVMRAHPECKEFICCMGSAFFVVNCPEAIDGEDNVTPGDRGAPAYMEPVAELLDEWDKYLKLTGEGFRFTARGPIVRDW